MTTRKALGRGLEALIPRRPEPYPAARLVAPDTTPNAPPREIAIEQIRANRLQPRQRFDAAKLEELAVSIRHNGLLQPLLVRAVADGYELVAGDRRLRAAKLAGLATVPVLLRDDVGDREALQLALLENVQREDLNPIEEARGYKRLLAEFGMSQQELADQLGKSRSAIANTLRLLGLPDELQARVEAGELSAGHARALLSAGSLEEQVEIATLVRERELTVRDAERLAQTKPRQRRTPAAANPALAELQKRLEARFGTRVRIRSGKSDGFPGRVEIDYYTLPDLEHVFEIAGVPYEI